MTNDQSKQNQLGWRDFVSAHELGWPLHVGLRKGCDSTTSSLVWNLVHVLDGPWNRYLECVFKRLKANEELIRPNNNTDLVATELKAAIEDLDDTIKGGDDDIRETMSFLCALKLLTEDDWKGITYYLVEKDEPKD